LASVAAPPQRRALGTLFLVLGCAFAGVAFAAANASGGGAARWVVAATAAAMAIWLGALAARAWRAG